MRKTSNKYSCDANPAVLALDALRCADGGFTLKSPASSVKPKTPLTEEPVASKGTSPKGTGQLNPLTGQRMDPGATKPSASETIKDSVLMGIGFGGGGDIYNLIKGNDANANANPTSYYPAAAAAA
jgi:hypothetical protein